MDDDVGVFSFEELQQQFNFSPILLPTKTECLRFVLSRTKYNGEAHDKAVLKMAREIQKIWIDADCCPFSYPYIVQQFKKEIWDNYLYLLREKQLPGSGSLLKRSHKKDVSKPNKYAGQPRRKSSRHGSSAEDSGAINEETCSLDQVNEDRNISVQVVKTRTQQLLKLSLRNIWEEEGKKLFDIKCQKNVLECLKKNQCFDEEFYEDQKSCRNYRMVLTKVTKEFIEQDK